MTVYDPLGAIANDFLSPSDSSGNWYMPAGTYAIVKRFADDNAWEPLRFMPGCVTSSSGSSSGIGCDCSITVPAGCVDENGNTLTSGSRSFLRRAARRRRSAPATQRP